MKKVIVTAKGSALKCNDWKEGQVIECHENLAVEFIKNGFAIDIDGTEKTKPEKTKEDKSVKQTKSKK
jgi:hypothetical protein